MVACSAISCKNEKGKVTGKSFHAFPFSRPLILNKWVEAVNRRGWFPKNHSVLCSDHRESDFDRTGQITRLRVGSIPSLLVNEPEGNEMENDRDQSLGRANYTNDVIMQDQISQIAVAEEAIISKETKTNINSTLLDHPYAVTDSPRKLKRKLLQEREKTYAAKKKLKLLNKRLNRMTKKVQDLKQVVRSLKDQLYISQDAAVVLENNFSGVTGELMQRMLKISEKPCREKYPADLRAFALTLQYYSTKAYEYVRKTFGLALPHPATIRSWYSSINGEPGFTDESFKALQSIVASEQSKGRQVLCSLMLDEMSIRKKIEYDGKTYHGYVNVGSNIDSDSLPVASDALVFMVVALNGSWKIPVAYFFIKGMTGEERANLIKLCLEKLCDVGIRIASLTCDGPSCHFSMLSSLGARMQVENAKPWFESPGDNHNINVVLDICHMLKLVRNAWEIIGFFKNAEGERIEYAYILKLHKFQEAVGLRAGNKLALKHISFKKQIMKVNIAAQTLSDSVANALQFCMEDLKLKEFAGASATIEFIKTIDKLFDFGNSRNPIKRGLKGPLRSSNMSDWLPFAEKALEYLKELSDPFGTPMHLTPRKTGFVGFYLSTLSILNIFQEYVNSPTAQLSYLFTYKLSQDHLELFFCSIRGRCGWNNNPSCRQFTAAYKKLLIKHEIKCSEGNAIPQDDTSILFATRNSCNESVTDIVDITAMRRMEISFEESNEAIPILNLEFPVGGSEFLDNIITYVSGYCIKMVRKKIRCTVCLDAMVENEFSINKQYNYDLLLRKKRGALIIPSAGVITVCRATEKFIRTYIGRNKGLVNSIFCEALKSQVLAAVGNEHLFPELDKHFLECTLEENHVHRLIKEIAGAFLKIRLHHESCKETELSNGELIRKQLSRLIIFSHQ